MLQQTRCSVEQFVAQKSITEMKHPPSSPDLAQNGFWLFKKKIKSNLKGRIFQDTEDIQKRKICYEDTETCFIT